MANDASNHPQNSSDADMTASGDHAEFDAVQLAQADTPQQAQEPQRTAAIPAVPNGTVHVDVPQGENVVRVAVANGETVILPQPFDDQAALAAKEGNGNLAIKVGDITVILEGYQQTLNDTAHPVVLKDEQGDQIDIAVVLASTDPNLDITTAAGPAAGAQGADNTGALLAQFDGGAGLAGLNAVGVLDQTALQYKLIDNSILLERADELSERPPLGITSHNPLNGISQSDLRDPAVYYSDFKDHLTYDEFIHGFGSIPGFDNQFADYDGTNAANATKESVHVQGDIVVDPHSNATVSVDLNITDLKDQKLTSDGVPLHYELSQDGSTIFGFRGDGSEGTDGALVLVIRVDDGTKNADGTTTFIVDYYLVNRIDDVTGTGDVTHIDVNFDVTTTDDQTGSGSTGADYLDDAPISADDTGHVGNESSITVPAGDTTGNDGLEANDRFGADGRIGGAGGIIGVEAGEHKGDTVTTGVGTDIKGDFGTLHLNADGSYTYTRFDDGPTLDKDGKTVIEQVDHFTYTIKDDDGDVSTATLTLDIKDSPVIIVPPPPPHDGDNPVDLNKSGTAVFESGLPDGSKSADDTETTKGTVTVTAKDEVGKVTVDGNDVKLDGTPMTIAGKHGDITVTWDSKNNELDYTYTLKDNDLDHSKDGNDIVPGEDFKVEVTDKDGDKSSGDINISIVDDVPTAQDDSLALGTGSKVTVNAADGVEKNDVFGADGKSGGGVVGVIAGDSGDTSSTGVGSDLKGQFGTLHLNADGSYTYTRFDDAPTNGDQVDKFTYTIKDGDGDTDTAILTVTMKDNPVIVIPPPPPQDGDNPVDLNKLGTAVFESALSDGSNPASDAETTQGVVKITALDGVSTVTVDGVTVNLADVSKTGTISGTYGDLTVTGWNAATGELSYTYTLKDNDPNHSKQGNDVIPGEQFTVVATDTDGDQSAGDIDISIVDDAPTAKDDSVTLKSGQSTYTSGVNVEGNDTFGADGKSVGGGVVGVHAGNDDKNGTTGVGTDIHGQFGTLHVNADGTFTYTRDNNDPITGTLSDKFTYTVKDGDGDLDSAVLTINLSDNPVIITPPDPPKDGDDPIELNKDGTAVFESALSDGSNPASTAESTTGSVKVSALDGVNTISIDGQAVKLDGSATTITGKFGDIVAKWDAANNEIDYTYTLKDNDPNHSKQGNDVIPGEEFKVEVTDTDGDKGQGDIDISIVDDVPTAKNDADTVNSPVGSKTSGNVITGLGDGDSHLVKDVSGADGPASVSAATGSGTTTADGKGGFDVVGSFGTLHVNADGSYSYTVSKAMEKGDTDTFTYTIRDSEGDTSKATLVIDANCIPDVTHLSPFTDKGEVTVSESGLPGGTHDAPSNTGADGSFKVDSHNEGFQNVTVEGVTIISDKGPSTIPAGGLVVQSDSHGTMTITSIHDDGKGAYTVSYHYELKDNIDGPDANNGHNTDTTTVPTIDISVTDKSGDKAASTIEVNVVDDVPQASDGIKVMGTDVQKNNVLLVLDVTGSMGEPYPTNNSPTNKLQFEVQAAQNLLNAYLAAGGGDPNNVRVQIVTFSVEGHNETTQWVTVAQALTMLDNIGNQTPDGNTNYDAGIDHAMQVDWTSGGAIPDGTNSTYFFSDGVPNQARPGDGNPGLNGSQLGDWIDYLKDNDINGYAIGMGAPNGSDMDAALDVVAYNGQGAGSDTQSINVTDPNSLSAQIIATIGTNSSGNLVGDLGGKYGADGPGSVHSITIEGKTYTFNGSNAVTASNGSTTGYTFNAGTHVLAITTTNGLFTVDLDTGAYTYHQNGGSEANVLVGWTIVDADGDISNGGSLYLLSPVPHITLAAEPVIPDAGDFNGSHTFTGDSRVNRLYGTDGDDYIDGKGGGDNMNGARGDDVYVVDSSNDVINEKFNQGTDTVLSSVNHTLTTNVEDLVLTGSSNLSGTGNALDNSITGNSGNNVLDGGAGNDVLVGGGGSDQMSGGAGNDQFLKVDSSDLASGKIDGGSGDDLVDLSHLATFKGSDTSRIDNVEVLSFNGGSGTAVTLDYNSVLGMTDANHNLVIHGDKGSDSVALSGGFAKIGADITANDGQHYDVFQAGSGSSLVTVFVDHNLNATAT